MSVISKRARASAASFTVIENFFFHSRYGMRARTRASAISPSATRMSFRSRAWSRQFKLMRFPTIRIGSHTKRASASPKSFLAKTVSQELGLAFEREDIALTSGAFAAISVALRLLLDAGDEAIFSLPPWFCYEPMLLAADAAPVKVWLTGGNFGFGLSCHRGCNHAEDPIGDRQHASQSDRANLQPRFAGGAWSNPRAPIATQLASGYSTFR